MEEEDHKWLDSSGRQINIGDLVTWASAMNSSGHLNYGAVVALKIGGGISKAPKVKVLYTYDELGNFYSEKLVSVFDRMIVIYEEQMPPKKLAAIRQAQANRAQGAGTKMGL